MSNSVDKQYGELVKEERLDDFFIADLVKLKFTSGNSVPVDRIVIKLEEVEKWL